ncbi:MAG: hypothetical protein ACJA13_001767 [Paraglaciecola sp.]|jgi:hypothetical protein
MITENNSPALNNAKKHSENTPLVLGVLALSAGLTMPGVAHANLIISDINVTVTNGSHSIDLDGDATDDFSVDSYSQVGKLKSRSKKTMFSSDSKYAQMFNSGSAVDGSAFDGTNGSTSSFIDVYRGFGGEWQAVGAHGFVGIKFWDGTGNGYRFGWLELTRGSLTIGKMGLQNAYNTAAAIPNAVPEPGSLLLLASGALGLIGLRRRNKLALAQNVH